MSQRTLTRSASATAAALMVASFVLAGCGDRRDDSANLNDMPATAAGDTSMTPSPTPPMTGSETTVDQNVREVPAADATADANRDLGEAARDTADRAGSKINDAVITTAVNTELAKDPALSALKIDVDTDGGRVLLKGTAPSQAARDRATQIASSVNGVVGVDNQLRVESGS